MGDSKRIVVYSDGSFKNGCAGLGAVVCVGNKAFVRGVPRRRLRSPLEAEAAAAAEALTDACIHGESGDHIELFVDNLRVCRFLSGEKVGEDTATLTHFFLDVIEVMIARKLSFNCFKVAAHGGIEEDYTDRNSFLNGVADCLAHVGRNGRTIEVWLPNDDTLEDRLAALDWRLDPSLPHFKRRTYSRAEAAVAIGVTPETVDILVRGGHLGVDQSSGRILNSTVRVVAREYALIGGRPHQDRAVGGVADAPPYQVVRLSRRNRSKARLVRPSR